MCDRKAVNPRARVDCDTRTLAEIMDNIAVQGQIVAEAPARLRRLLGAALAETDANFGG